MCIYVYFFFFNDTATTEIYTLSLHDALPISRSPAPAAPAPPSPPRTGRRSSAPRLRSRAGPEPRRGPRGPSRVRPRGARAKIGEHTSELQSRQYLVCRLLLEKKKNQTPSPSR